MIKTDLKTPGVFEKMYTDIGNRLNMLVAANGSQIIKTIDLWNNQWGNLSTEKPFEFPSVFIEFNSIPWRSIGGNIQMGEAVVKLHIGSKTNATSRHRHEQSAEFLKHLRTIDALHLVLRGWGQETGYMSAWSRIDSQHDHDHDDIIAHVETYKFTVKDYSACSAYTKLTGDKFVLEVE